MSAKHDDNGGYPHDCYPDRRKAADRRARDAVVLPSGAILQRPSVLPAARVIREVQASVRLFLKGEPVGSWDRLRRMAPPGSAHGVEYFEGGQPVHPADVTPWPALAPPRTRREFLDRLAAAAAISAVYRPAERWPEDPRMLSRDDLVRRALRARR